MYGLPIFISFHGFKFRNSFSIDCHDLAMLYHNLRVVAIITFKGVDYFCVIHDIIKSKAINLLETFVLEVRGYI